MTPLPSLFSPAAEGTALLKHTSHHVTQLSTSPNHPLDKCNLLSLTCKTFCDLTLCQPCRLHFLLFFFFINPTFLNLLNSTSKPPTGCSLYRMPAPLPLPDCPLFWFSYHFPVILSLH